MSCSCHARFTPRKRGRGFEIYFIEVDGGGQARVGDVAVRSGRVALTRVHDGGLRRGIEEGAKWAEFGSVKLVKLGGDDTGRKL